MARIIVVNDKMQRGYSYELAAPAGCNCAPDFEPELTPAEMLQFGVFCGKYLTDCRAEFPASWFANARLTTVRRDCSLNYFGVDASQPCRSGGKKAGSTPTIHAGGSSGTVDTI